MLDPAWPNLFIPGAAKAGTTSLHRYLGQHPEIHMSPEKEPHFFTQTWEAHREDAQAWAKATEAYLELFRGGQDRPVRGESTPGYLHVPEVPDRIARTVGQARIVISLRDPIERAHSDHSMHVRKGMTDQSFLSAIQAELEAPEGHQRPHIDRGLYGQHVARWMEAFGQDNVHVVLFEDLKHDTLGVLESIATFLDVDPGAMAEVGHETVHNPGGTPRNAVAAWLLNDERVHRAARMVVPEPVRIWLGDHALVETGQKPPLEPAAAELLAEVFEPEISRLEVLLDRSLPELRRAWP